MTDDLEQYRIYRNILVIDLKSFYASVECADAGLDPFKTPLVVADIARGKGTICLAVSPYLRAKGVPGRLRVFDLPKNEKIIFKKPRMHRYLEASAKVVSIYLRYVSKEDIHIYSVDECFLDFTEYRKLYPMPLKELARKILDDIYQETKLFATVGIGPNMLMAKLAMDIEAKKNKSQIAEWNYEDVPYKLYAITPLSKMWGIGTKTEVKLNRMGFRCVGDIAKSDVEIMKKRFGVLGEELWYHTHGIDMSLIQDKKKYKALSKSYGIGQVLFTDYYRETAPQLFLEMSDELSSRLRATEKYASVVHLYLGYNQDFGGGLAHQVKLDTPINLGSDITDKCMDIFNRYYHDEPIRNIGISLSGLVSKEGIQLNLFEDVTKKKKEEKLFDTMDEIKRKYGKNAVRRASTELDYSTAKSRNEEIGGHHE